MAISSCSLLRPRRSRAPAIAIASAHFQKGSDKIDLSDIDARPDVSGNQAFTFINKSAFSSPGQVCYSQSNGNTIVSGNTDFDSSAEFQIELTGLYTLSAADFVL